jgi:hypothetical protein
MQVQLPNIGVPTRMVVKLARALVLLHKVTNVLYVEGLKTGCARQGIMTYQVAPNFGDPPACHSVQKFSVCVAAI